MVEWRNVREGAHRLGIYCTAALVAVIEIVLAVTGNS